MRARALMAVAAVAALLAALPVVAGAQTATPTATPAQATATPAQATATPFPTDSARGKAVQRVYDDYRRDGVIAPCQHTQRALQDTLDTIQPSFDQDYPDFRAALEAGIQRHERGRCDDATSSPSATATPTATATATVTAAPTASPSATPASGLLPGGGGGSGSDSGSGAGSDAGSGDDGSGVTPGALVTPTPTASPFVTPTPTAAAPRSVVEPAANATALTLPRILLAIALIGGALLGLSALLASRGGRLAGVRHAWREAGLRTRATWSDFADWLRLGR